MNGGQCKLMKKYNSLFPTYIDDRMFFCDINIEQVPIMQSYQSYIKDGNYTAASKLLNKSDVFFYGAWFLNVIEERLNKIGHYLVEQEEKNVLQTYQENEPIDLIDNMNWIA